MTPLVALALWALDAEPSPVAAQDPAEVAAEVPVEVASAWSPLTVARCDDAPVAMPRETEVALASTLIVHTREGTGSAVVISPDGFVLTAAHVVDGHREVLVTHRDGREQPATIVRIDHAQDAALLHLTAAGDDDRRSPCLPLLVGDAALGSDVFLLGSPAGEALGFSVSKGIVSGHRKFDDASFVQLDASVNPGNSGGPALDAEGRVVGIASWKVSHVSMEGLAFAVPSAAALAALHLRLDASTDLDWERKAVAFGEPTSSPPSAATATRPRERVRMRGRAGIDVDAIRRRHTKRALVLGGVVSLVGGVVLVTGTYAAYRRQHGVGSDAGWRMQRGLNTVGWTFGIAGAISTVVGLALPKRVGSSDSAARASLRLAFDPNTPGMSLAGEF